MNVLRRTRQLLKQANTARQIQIACLIKQAIRADEVVLIKPTVLKTQNVTTIWSDGGAADRADNGSSLDADWGLSQEELRSLAQIQAGDTNPLIHYYQDGFLWKSEDIESDRFQSIRMQMNVDGKLCVFIWTRHPERQFSEVDRHRFESLFTVGKLPISGEEGPATRKNGYQASLTPTERKVLTLLHKGFTERAISQELHRSPNTIHVHVRNIYRKFLVNSRAELIELTGGPLFK